MLNFFSCKKLFYFAYSSIIFHVVMQQFQRFTHQNMLFFYLGLTAIEAWMLSCILFVFGALVGKYKQWWLDEMDGQKKQDPGLAIFLQKFLIGSFRLGQLKVNYCPAGSEPNAGADIREKLLLENEETRLLGLSDQVQIVYCFDKVSLNTASYLVYT